MPLFGIWNRGYKQRVFEAPTIEEALRLAIEAKHIKTPRNYRKWRDVTHEQLTLDLKSV